MIVEKDKTGESCYLQVNSIAMTTDFEKKKGSSPVYRETKNSIPICLTRGLDSKSTYLGYERDDVNLSKCKSVEINSSLVDVIAKKTYSAKHTTIFINRNKLIE